MKVITSLNRAHLFDSSRLSAGLLKVSELPGLRTRDYNNLDCDGDRSTDDDNKLKHGRVKTILLDPVPNASGFKNYQLDVYTKVIAVSKRSAARMLRWIQQGETATLEQLERPRRS